MDWWNSIARQSERVCRWRRACQNRCAGFSLVELLTVIAIIGILLALLLPAVQAARESANRLQCANHLKQIGLGWQLHHDAHQFLPTGGWGWGWTGDPDRGYGPEQPGGWAFNILPFVGEDVVHSIGAGMSASAKSTACMQRLTTPISLFYCPSRRAATLYPNVLSVVAINCADLPMVARGDYVANVGNPNTPIDPVNCLAGAYCQCNVGPPSLAAADNGTWALWANTTAFNGVSAQRSTVAFRQVTDGLSQTLMVGEKQMNPDNYETGTYGSDNEDIFVGFDDDIYATSGFGPLQDNTASAGSYQFGSIHSGAFNAVFCDGSVRQINYEIDTSVFSALGSRSGSEVLGPMDVGF